MTTQHEVHIPVWTLGDRLRKARENAGLSQQELADAIGVARNTVGNGELGDHRPLPITLRAWADATGVPLTWLLTGDTPPRPGHGLPRLDSNQKPPGLRYGSVMRLIQPASLKVAA